MFRRPFLLAGLAVFALAGGDMQPEPYGKVVGGTALTGWRGADGAHYAALRLQLAPGWKTYWRAPGDTGIPPQFTWENTRNVAEVEVHWPVPQVFYVNGFRTIGYETEVVLPLIVAPARAGEDALLAGRVELGVCEEICIPVTLALELPLPAGRTTPDPRIEAALASAPLTAAEAGVSAIDCHISRIEDGMRLDALIEMPGAGTEEVVVEYADKAVWVSEPQAARASGALKVSADLVPPEGQPFLLARADLVFTVFSEGSAVEVQGCEAP